MSSFCLGSILLLCAVYLQWIPQPTPELIFKALTTEDLLYRALSPERCVKQSQNNSMNETLEFQDDCRDGTGQYCESNF
jgi:hypothetical protein